jgi:alpha/beta superfamily hydrolase
MDIGLVTLPRSADPVCLAVTAAPVLIDGAFAWLHRPPLTGADQRDVAVLICPPLGWDAMHAHHGLRILADRLAAAGYPTLRLHYRGTGNAADAAARTDGSADYWRDWQEGVSQAADWLRCETGASRILLAGLRFGALLAGTVAATRRDCAGLLLLAPVLRGKSYLRQLDMEARLETGIEADAAGGVDFHELRFSPGAAGDLAAADLRQAALPEGCRVAVFAQASSQVLSACLDRWEAQRLEVHRGGFDGLSPLLQETIHNDPPPPDFTAVLRWVEQAFPDLAPSPAPATHAIWPTLLLAQCTEEPVAFGPEGRLFGILCRPAAAHSGAPLVIIANTGRDPHYGIARYGTELARRLAEAGMASLRMDFAGLGDSRLPPGQPDVLSPVFELDRSQDITAAIDAMQARGYQSFAVQGLCAGAYHAFWAAERDERIAALILLNMPLFAWQGGDTVRTALWHTAPVDHLVLRLGDRAAWARVLRGQSEVRGILRVLGRRLAARLARVLPAAFARNTAPPSPAHVAAATSLSQRGVRALFLYGLGDPGLDALSAAFGPGGASLAAMPGMDVRLVRGIDHVLSGRYMREKATNEVLSFLLQAFPQGESGRHEHSFHHPDADGHRGGLAAIGAGAAA